MNWLLFYLLAALHPVAFLVIAWKCNTWKLRFILWALLPLPAIWYCWDYYAIKNEHTQMCAAQGGLKVLIQPEKVDRVRFVGDSFGELQAKAALETFYPRVQLVQTMTDARGSDGRRLPYYVSVTAIPNPKEGQWIKGTTKEGRFSFPSTKVVFHDPTMYEISVQEVHTPYRSTVTETLLSKQGKVYAKHTEIVHWWAGIRYPDAVPTWRCPDTNRKQPPANDPSATQEKWSYPESAVSALRNLIF